ncbi:F-box/FBD/LRR-repeat protein At1g13570 isoform X2 [Aegilops tauschii subsp. strangulata]|uniref:F-box/FBD/LRR-repeat protein At1g13570 isoform X2 n=1 Tax=Aegilops tauschii subsp. strangulata TaxID=200361 RepID=UPI001E1CACB6|nr:F-box/FBD/LRR-repeat protein At1g78750 isoform X2 [Aegilops tauschii subsp. strangulata]
MDSEAMSTCKKARAEAASVVSTDRLSNLPPEIKGDILSRLNVEEAVRTSTLSSTWRDAWTDMPVISLCDGNLARTKFVTLVDMVLLLHKGTIEEFDISGNKNYHDEFGRWMIMLSRKSPKSVIIKLNSGPRYKIPSCLFSIGDLEYLHLENCIISLPRAFQGDFEDIKLDAPNLEVAFLSLDKAYQSVPIAHDKESYVKQSLGSLSVIETLTINGFFLKYLSKGCIHTKLPAVFTHLESVRIMICLWDQRQVLTACSLFQNAPNLKKLEMWSFPWSILGRDEDQVGIQGLNLQLQMDHLVMASVNHFGGLDCEVDFVAKLLSWAPALEELKIDWKGEMECSMVLAKLLALPRASTRAKVIVTF